MDELKIVIDYKMLRYLVIKYKNINNIIENNKYNEPILSNIDILIYNIRLGLLRLSTERKQKYFNEYILYFEKYLKFAYKYIHTDKFYGLIQFGDMIFKDYL
jgi:hypothetical protein